MSAVRPVGALPAGPPDDDEARTGRQAALISLVTVVVSAANYGFSLVLIRLLSDAGYVAYASVQSLLLVLGTGCMAAVPWAVARHVALVPATASDEQRRRARSEALHFGLLASLVQGLGFAVLALVVVVPVSGWALGGSTALASLAMSLVAAPLGLLQGLQRIGTIAWLRLVETGVRLAVSVLLLVAVAASPVSPVAGFGVGSLVLLVCGFRAVRSVFPLHRASSAVARTLLRQSGFLAVVQIALASIGAVDTVVVGYAQLGSGPGSAYQIAALLGRVPLFLSAAVALSYYQRIAGAPDEAAARTTAAGALRQFLLLGLPSALLVGSCPQVLLGLVAPGRAAEVHALTPYTAVVGIGVGLVTVVSTLHQARGRFLRSAAFLLPVALVQPVVLVLAGRSGGVHGFALAGTLLLTVLTVAVVVDARGPWMRGLLDRGDVAFLVVGAVLAVGARVEPWAWVGAAGALGVLCLTALRGTRPGGRVTTG